MSFKTYFVGRSPRESVVIDHPSVSRKHCELTVSGDHCMVVDAGSSGGTFYRKDGQWKRISSHALSIDNELKIGGVSATLRQLINKGKK